MTNRVDELESQVETLQATVDGLTEELVEAKERIRLLEESVDVDLTDGTRSVGYDSDINADGRDDAADTVVADDGTGTDDAAPETGGGSDPLAESQAQAASRSQTSNTPSDDASFIDADAESGTGASSPVGGDSDPTVTDGSPPSEAPDGDGTKSDGADDCDGTTDDDDDIIVA